MRRGLLVEEWLEDNDFVALFDKGHEGTEHSLIGAGRDRDLGFWVDISTKERRVGFCDCFLQPRSSLESSFSNLLLHWVSISLTFVGAY